MGAPTDMLVLVSIMYDNPKGLTKEEIVDKIKSLKLDSNLSGLAYNLNNGLYGFANLFNLNHNSEYLINKDKYWNENYKYHSKRNVLFFDKKEVIHTKHKSIGKTFMIYHDFYSSEFTRFEGFKKNQYVWRGDFSEIEIPEEYNKPKNSFLVRNVLDTKIKDFDEERCLEIKQLLDVEVVELTSRTFRFNSFEDLWKKYPEYHPERKFNFNQESGFLYPHKSLYALGGPSFKWLKKENKYFLDINKFQNILNANSYFGNEDSWKHKKSKDKSRYSLTDVVLTSEAIRRKNWKILGYNALFNYNKNFVYKNEKTLRKYEKAVFDTEESMKAQNKGMNNLEFLREHHFNNLSRNIVPHKEIKKMLKEENKQRGIKKRKTTIKWKKEKQNQQPELPF